MAARAQTPNYGGYDSLNNGLASGKAADPSPLANATGSVRPLSTAYSYVPGDDFEATGPTIQQLEGAGLHRTASSSSRPGGVSRSNTLTKKNTLTRKTSLKRSGSRKSLAAGSIKGVQIDDPKRAVGDEYNSAFYCPVPTTGSPTEILANRFQAWRKFLKDLIAYFKEVQSSYEQRSRALLKVANVINNTQAPSIFMTEGGLNEANRILRNYHRQAVAEANKSRDIEEDVITQLAGLRADLGQKIKEIKSLSGDFKNSVDKEKDHTRRAINGLQEALNVVDRDANALVGKEDPYIIRLSVDRQIERQLDEENYLHRAYLNLEGSGRELESIVVGEVQKAYNALASIMKREADESYNTVDALRTGPVTIPKDLEWKTFIDADPHFISSDTPLRKVEDIEYPGKTHPAAAEVRAGMLERKSKYLKSYTPGWYVLSPTHLHEFKSADHIYSQSPVMSLLLSDQKLGSHSQPGSSSHKFMLKGRQTGTMHRGHSWVFRAETYDTMLAWFDDIRALTEKTGEERNAFVRKHARSFSAGSHRASSISGDSAMDEDEADEVPFSATQSLQDGSGSIERDARQVMPAAQKRPEPGGRFPSDLNINRHLQAPLSHSSGSSMAEQHRPESDGNERYQDISAMAGGLQPETTGYAAPPATTRTAADVPFPLAAATVKRDRAAPLDAYENTAEYQQTPTNVVTAPYVATAGPEPTVNSQLPLAQVSAQPPSQDPFLGAQPSHQQGLTRHSSDYASWMAPAAGGAAVGGSAVAAEEYWRNRKTEAKSRQANEIQELDAADSGKTPAVAEPVAVPHTPLPLPVTTEVSAGNPQATGDAVPYSPVTLNGDPSEGMSVLSESTAATELTESPSASKVALLHTAYDTARDGTVNAEPTGRFFPTVLRHNTDTSISNLHVPGEFPKQ